MGFIRRHPLLSYFLLAYIFTWAIEVPMLRGARGIIDVHLPMWLEALAADYGRLADLDPATIRRLREAAGRIAFPERSERRALSARRR